jgi:hypothetical protein
MQTRTELDASWKKAADRCQRQYNTRVVAAIKATMEFLATYWETTLRRRLFGHEEQQGSYWVAADMFEINQALLRACWWPHRHPHVLPGCVAFKADIPLIGRRGVINLRQVPADTEVKLVDPKNTGEAFLEIEGFVGNEAKHSVIILGLEDGQEVVFTVHPGDPAPHIGLPLDLVKAQLGDITTITAAQALEFGLTFAATS